MNKRILGISLLAVFIISIILTNPAFTTASNVQYDEKKVLKETVEAYKEAIKKLLKYSEVNETLKNEIKGYLDDLDDSYLESLSTTELQNILDTLTEYFSILRENLSVSSDLSVSLETHELQKVIESAIKTAESLNLTEVKLLLEDASNAISDGNLKLAKELLDEAEGILEKSRTEAASKETLKAAIHILEELTESSGSGNILSYIEYGISNVNATIEILLDLKDTLISMNVSQEIIDAVGLAITNLNRTTTILSNVMWNIESSNDESHMEDIIKESMDDGVWEEINEIYRDINKTLSKVTVLENLSLSLNNTEALELLNTSKSLLEAAKQRLDEATIQAETGNYTAAMMLIYEADYYKDQAKHTIEYIKHLLGVSPDEEHEGDHHDDSSDENKSGDSGEDHDDDNEENSASSIIKALQEYEEKVNKSLASIAVLRDKAVSMNSTEAITYIDNATALLDEALTKIDLAKQAIDNSDYDTAHSLLRSVSQLIDLAKEYIDMAEDALDHS